MKYIAGFIGALIITIILEIFSHYIFNVKISEWLIGWLSCVGYYLVKESQKYKILTHVKAKTQ